MIYQPFSGFLDFRGFIFLNGIKSAFIIGISWFFARKIGRNGRFSRYWVYLAHQGAQAGVTGCCFLAQLMPRSMFQQMALMTNRDLLRNLVLAVATRIP